jgi:hypothetical protein
MGKLSWLSFFKKPKVFVPLVILLAFVMIIFLAVRSLNAPAVGTISQTPPAKAEVRDPYADPGTYNGKYISFNYPEHYKKIPSQKTGSILEVADFYATDQTSKQISLSVIKENITDDSGIRLRRQQPAIYHEEPRTKTGIIEFSSTSSGSERTAFVPHDDMVAAIAVTAPPDWDLAPDMQTILISLKWK